ncbi:Cytidylyltransferase family protein [compost metagenome]
MIFFDNVYIAIIGPLSFTILNYISCKKDLIKIMEREEEQKDGYGTVYYALSLLILAICTFGIFNNPDVGLVAVLTMAFGDGFAALVGKNIKSKKYYVKGTEKSIAGSSAMFIISAILVGTYLFMAGSGLWFAKTIIITAIVTLLEAISIKGTDNITVPLSVYLMICLAI